MAETKKAGRPKKTETTPKTETKVENSTDDTIKQLMALIEEQNKKMAEMQQQIEDTKSQQTVVVQSTESKFKSKKIRCINLMHNPLNVSTEPYGKGKTFEFEKYGDSRLISYDDLANIVACYPNTCQQGCIYITDKDAVDELDLTEFYDKNVYSKEMIDTITAMREEVALELFLGLGKDLMESTAIAIAERIAANEAVDYNYLVRIKAETEIDINALAEEIKSRNK